jgi:soluble lytic murein transglycosylase-like protein
MADVARRRRRRSPRLRLRLALRNPRLQRALQRAGLVALCTLIMVNGAVRWLGGGDPGWLSPFFLREKVQALAALSLHVVGHGPTCDPEAAPGLVAEAARRNGIAIGLALAVARTESSLHAHAISRTGAMGVMQLMPATALGLGVSDAFDPQQNTDAGARYLAQLLRRYAGDRVRALAAYNLGPARVPARGALALPAETRAYVSRILGAGSAAASL